MDSSQIFTRLAIFVGIWLVLAYLYMSFAPRIQVEDISYTRFKSKVSHSEVAEVEIQGQKVSGRYVARKEEATSTLTSSPAPPSAFPAPT